MKSKKADITTVAKVAKVSPSTVSRFFNHPDLLQASTRKRIERAVRKTGYIRNRAAQTIHGIRSGTIGVLVPTLDHAIFAEVVQAFSDAVAQRGFSIMLASHGYDQNQEYAMLRKFLEHRVDGVVLTGLDHDPAVFQLIDQQKIPAVLMWNYSQSAPYPAVGTDNQAAGRMIAQHVLDQGHRAIACMFPPASGNDRAAARRSAVLETLAAAGVTVPNSWMLETVYSLSASKRDVVQVLDQDAPPTALICGNDILAMGAIFGAMAHGTRVPDDLSIAGIGDFKGASVFEPGLTTVRLPAQDIGRRTCDAIVAQILTPHDADTEGHNCPPTLIVRQSTRRLR